MNWKRVASWSAIALSALAVSSIAIALVLFHSGAFKNYLLEKIQQTASESLNTPVRMQNLGLHFSPLSADLYGVTVRGTEPGTEPPLLTIDHIKIGITIISIIRRETTSMPDWALMTTTTVSTAGRAAMALPIRSGLPGVSMTLMRLPR